MQHTIDCTGSRVTAVRLQGLNLVENILSKPFSPGIQQTAWNTHALINVEDPSRFNLRLDVVRTTHSRLGLGEQTHYIVGIVPKSAKLNVTDIEKKTGVFLDLMSRKVYDKPKIGCIVQCDWQLQTERFTHFNWFKFPIDALELIYIDGSLYIAHRSGPRQKIVENIPPGDYRPCVSIKESGTEVRLQVSTPARKRGREECCEALRLTRTLWENRIFSDAKVSCGSQTFPVHRCILAAASPVFAKAFQGEMREARDRELTMNGEDPEVIASLLHYVYTRSLPAEADVSSLLPVAHRYELADLVELCASSLIDGLDDKNVARCVATLRPYRDDQAIKDVWRKVSDRISNNPSFVQSLMEGRN
jgi:hypothetical protein